MPRRDEIVAFLDAYLDAHAVADYGPNGLQVEGDDVVHSVVLGVSASHELFLEAARRGAHMVVVHHGILWDRDPRMVTGLQKRRLETLLTHGISLVAYHLPLDRHPEVGNNVLLARELGLGSLRPFGHYRGVSIGTAGILDPPVDVAEVVERIRRVAGTTAHAFLHGPERVGRVGIVSGAAAEGITEAIAERMDLYLTGEAKEPTLHTAREAGIHFVAAGHYNTERPGVQALGRLLRERFGVDSFFVDLPNPV